MLAVALRVPCQVHTARTAISSPRPPPRGVATACELRSPGWSSTPCASAIHRTTPTSNQVAKALPSANHCTPSAIYAFRWPPTSRSDGDGQALLQGEGRTPVELFVEPPRIETQALGESVDLSGSAEQTRRRTEHPQGNGEKQRLLSAHFPNR